MSPWQTFHPSDINTIAYTSLREGCKFRDTEVEVYRRSGYG